MNERSIPSLRSLFAAAVSAWLITLAVDFVLHAAILASWWQTTQDYWLPPMTLFQNIPFAYVSFALYCGSLVWALTRFYGPRLSLRQGLQFGAIAGLVFGTMAILANYSVFPLPISALLVWPLSTTIESAAAGAIAVWTLNAPHPWRRVGVTLGIALGLFVLGVIIQNVLFPGAGSAGMYSPRGAI